MKVHCVYIPDATLSICRMSLLLKQNNEHALCLYSGCHFEYMPDATFDLSELVKGHWDYIPDVILSICRMSLQFNKKRGSAL